MLTGDEEEDYDELEEEEEEEDEDDEDEDEMMAVEVNWTNEISVFCMKNVLFPSAFNTLLAARDLNPSIVVSGLLIVSSIIFKTFQGEDGNQYVVLEVIQLNESGREGSSHVSDIQVWFYYF